MDSFDDYTSEDKDVRLSQYRWNVTTWPFGRFLRVPRVVICWCSGKLFYFPLCKWLQGWNKPAGLWHSNVPYVSNCNVACKTSFTVRQASLHLAAVMFYHVAGGHFADAFKTPQRSFLFPFVLMIIRRQMRRPFEDFEIPMRLKTIGRAFTARPARAA